MGKGPEQTVSLRYYSNGQQVHKKMLTIINNDGNSNQIHSELSVRMTITKKTSDNKCWEICGEKETLVYCRWKCKWCSHRGKQYGGS